MVRLSAWLGVFGWVGTPEHENAINEGCVPLELAFFTWPRGLLRVVHGALRRIRSALEVALFYVGRVVTPSKYPKFGSGCP